MREFSFVSLFAGCGGSSLGYKMAGGRCLTAVELDYKAAQMYRLNNPGVPVLVRDVRGLTADELMESAGIREGELDVLDGSPPCQGFSIAGARNIDDPRNGLWLEYVRLLTALRPKAFVMENARGLAMGKMKPTFHSITRALIGAGYRVRCRLLNASWFGVPQHRERLIWVGARDDLNIEPEFPATSDPVPLAAVVPGAAFSSANNSWRLTWRPSSMPSATICSYGPGKQSGLIRTCDGEERRMSEEELLRVCTFPDDYKLCGSSSARWRAIGNAAPPLFMKAVAACVREAILERRGRVMA